MGNTRLKNIARIALILVGVATFVPRAVSAGEYGVSYDAAGAYPAPITPIYPWSGSHGYQAWTPWDYTFPILAAHQFPAVIADQPGSQVGYLRTILPPGRLGGRPYLYHP